MESTKELELKEELRKELKEELRKELKEELRKELELEEQLAEEIMNDIKAECPIAGGYNEGRAQGYANAKRMAREGFSECFKRN